jgi:hypothetical protein
MRNPNDPIIFDIPDALVPAGYYNAEFASATGHLIVNEWADEELPPATTLLDDPGGYGHAPDGPPTPQLLARLATQTGVVYIAFYEVNRQGELSTSPGLTWAQDACTTTERAYGDDLTIIALRSCSL